MDISFFIWFKEKISWTKIKTEIRITSKRSTFFRIIARSQTILEKKLRACIKSKRITQWFKTFFKRYLINCIRIVREPIKKSKGLFKI